MKKLAVFIFIFMKLASYGQTTMNIFQTNGTTLYIPLGSIDSSVFITTPPPTSMKIYQSNGNVLTITVSDIDSITYTIPNPSQLAILSTNSISNVSSVSAVCGGNITSDGGSAIIQRGVCWSLAPNPTIANNHTINGIGIGQFFSTITPLQSNTTYYVRAYAINSTGTSYGNEISFNTSVGTGLLATVATTAPVSTTYQTVLSGGDIIADGGTVVTARGVCWAIGTTPTINHGFTNDGQGIGTFTSAPYGLLPNTTYFIRAYATNSAGTAYGSAYSFSTTSYPSIITANPASISYTSANLSATVAGTGGCSIIGKGFCYDSNPHPDFSGQFTNNNVGAFNDLITGLQNNTTYYVKSYTIFSCNSAPPDTVFGNEIAFTTLAFTTPTISTIAISNISFTNASGGGNIGADGGTAVIQRGVCWNILPNPTISDSLTNNGNGSGPFTSSLFNLIVNTVYYVRAYAINAVGISYGNEVIFTTLPPTLPTISTIPVSNITQVSAISGGNIISDGYSPVINKGICWSTTQNPTLSNFNTSAGTGIGVFADTLIGLSPNTIYYVRAFATNNIGTSYGVQESFTTNGPPTVATTTINSINQISAIGVGIVISSGSSQVTAKGVCWSIVPGPTLANNFSINGCCIGGYSSLMQGLSPSTTYYVRAYATNLEGTSYGSELTFTTLDPILPTVSTNIFSNDTLGLLTAAGGGIVSSDGYSTVTARGVCWGTTSSPTVVNNSFTVDGNGVGTFSSQITALSPGTIYYVRAYATNSIGTAYGNEVVFSSFPFIGQVYQGGKIVYIDSTGLHGLISATTDISSGILWHGSNSGLTGATGSAIGTGLSNTNAIVALYGSEVNAASICYNYSGGGYTDWFLPSQGELSVMCNNSNLIGGFAGPYVFYWTSTEQADCCAVFYRIYPSCAVGGSGKSWDTGAPTNWRVRPARYF
jgi:hypothetical protein